jgi:hypothetical protein
LPEDGIDFFTAKVLALAAVCFRVFLPAAQRGLREIHIHHLAGSARFGRDAGRASVTEQVENASFLAVVTQITTSNAQVQKQMGVLPTVIAVDLEGLAHLLNPDGFGSLLRMEQLRGLARATLPDNQLLHSKLLPAPVLQLLPLDP